MVSPLEALLTANGWRTVSSLTTKATKAAAEIATHHVIVGELKGREPERKEAEADVI